MKIVQTAHAFPPSRGGIEHHVFHLSRELMKLDNKVVVITTKEKGTKAVEDAGGVKIRRFWSINIPRFTLVRWPIGAIFTMIEENGDVYASHGYGSFMPLCTSIAALIRRKPFIFTLHGYPEVSAKKKIFYYLYRFFIAPIFLTLAKRVIVVSTAGAGRIEKEVDKKKIIYISNAIDDEFNCDISYENKKKITYIGRLDEDKGVDILIRAFAKIKDRHPDITLQLIGKDDGAKASLQVLAETLKVQPVFSEIPYEEMPAAYCDSKAVVLPSKYEGFSLVWLEAMASGRPMFSTPVGEAPKFFDQVYDKDKDLFLFKNEEELVDKLNAFLSNQKKYEKIMDRAKYIVKEEYSWENVAAQTLNVYKEALGK